MKIGKGKSLREFKYRLGEKHTSGDIIYYEICINKLIDSKVSEAINANADILTSHFKGAK